VGLLGDKRPRVLPPMEIIFRDKGNPRPVYDYQIKQEWEKHVFYECPAHLTPTELRSMERIARETFVALDCRDVARVDLRMDDAGEIYVLEVNPLPGLTPGYSDLCLIAKAANIDYRSLIGEILAGGLKRMREKRRAEAREAEAARAPSNGNGNGNGESAREGGKDNGKSENGGRPEAKTSSVAEGVPPILPPNS
jgi:D-alanine-D-alanine ligase